MHAAQVKSGLFAEDELMSLFLNMIVRNEASRIARALASVRPLIDGWVIVDTGSTDGTQKLVSELLAELPGALYEEPWQDFETNRNAALAHAKAFAGPQNYILFMDADDAVVNEGVELIVGGADCYEIEEHDQNLRFWRPCIVRASLPWRWVGKTHECLVCDAATRTERLRDIYRLRGTKTNEQYKTKLERDLDILSSSDSDDPRTCFYLAQTLKDLGRLQEALTMYDKRASLAGWDEERWWAQYEAAILHERLGRSPAEVMHVYLQVFGARPTRAEPLAQLARYCRDRRWFHQALMFIDQGIQIPFPGNDRLFVDEGIYTWKMLDEFAIATYWVGRYDASRDACKQLLKTEALPPNDRKRIEQNLQFANDRLAQVRSN